MSESSRTDEVSDLRSQISRLRVDADLMRRRVHRLEQILLSAYGAFVAVMLIAGSFLPIATGGSADQGDEETWSVARFAFSFTVHPDSEAADDEQVPDATFIIGFLGLFLVTVLILVVLLPSAAARTLTPRKLTFTRVLVGLGLTGSLVPLGLTLMTIGDRDSDPGPGAVVLIIGMLACLPLVIQTVQSTAPRPTHTPDNSAKSEP